MSTASPLYQQTQSSTRPTDPNVLQRQASKPDESVWVSASAGSGKTKVLTERILRLLLPDANGFNATPPNKILALTFTKAGASEMSLRIRTKLSDWAVMNDPDLADSMQELYGHAVSGSQLNAARKLFANVIDAPEGLKIMTIHSFCQSLLGRFPLEASLNPNFQVLTENEAKSFIQKSIQKTLQLSHENKGSPQDNAIHNLFVLCNQDQIYDLINKLLSERKQFTDILEKNFGIEGLYTALCKELNIPAGKTENDLIFQACDDNAFSKTDLYHACKILAESKGKKDQERSIIIQQWLDQEKKERALSFDIYKTAFLKKDGGILSALLSKSSAEKYPDVLQTLETEALRLFELDRKLNAVFVSQATRDLFLIGEEVYKYYAQAKEEQGLLDFDDLILKSLNLLKGQTPKLHGLDASSWVRFKLDQGIDHILVDEAQDTNPEQWEIIEALCDDFFSGESAYETQRTLFVVGDEKQSIYSFQRASPKKFMQMHSFFKTKITQAEKVFNPVNFNISFRSTKPVLELVDAVFSDENIKKGLGLENVTHDSYRKSQPGLVELWPLFESPEKQETDPWAPPVTIVDSASGASQMASHVGETIANWIKNKEILESYDRPIEAGDIMILVRSRTVFLEQLVRALKIRNIPVSGIDRMVLSDQLIVQDLCAAAQFGLLPEDDLILATVLKSPFIGWDEDRLFKYAHNRTGTLWQNVKNCEDSDTVHWLSELIRSAGSLQPYEFFMTLLQKPCPADSISGLRALKKRLGDEILDPLEEFLNTTLEPGTSSVPTLQNFIQDQVNNETQIKRQMEESGQAVRIMTVHAAKGLQAPIVILPDTVRTSNAYKPEKILWPDRTEENLPYFCPISKKLPVNCQHAFDTMKARNDEEYRRLFYVALTRAESRLYIGGYKGSTRLNEDSWYRYAQKGFEKLENTFSIERDGLDILQYKQDATDHPDRKVKASNTVKINNPDVPVWLFEPVAIETEKSKTIAPSQPAKNEVPVSPLMNADQTRFVRGNITHKLLQFLPSLPMSQWELSAKAYVSQSIYGLSKAVQTSIVSEVMALLTTSSFKEIFGTNSFAEVPITGVLKDGITVSGQIDRLLIKDKEIYILDYKTNRPPPQNVADIPAVYRTQMATYAAILREIYPDHIIRTALIWTDGPRLMEIEGI